MISINTPEFAFILDLLHCHKLKLVNLVEMIDIALIQKKESIKVDF